MFDIKMTRGKDHEWKDKIIEGNPWKYLMSIIHMVAAGMMKEITILSIDEIRPVYEIWQKVLILSTEELGEVAELVEEDSEKAVNWYSIEYFWIRVWEEETPKHISEIAKLPNDL